MNFMISWLEGLQLFFLYSCFFLVFRLEFLKGYSFWGANSSVAQELEQVMYKSEGWWWCMAAPVCMLNVLGQDTTPRKVLYKNQSVYQLCLIKKKKNNNSLK